MNTTETLTVKLHNGATVLARMYKGRAIAKTFTNYSQAYKAAGKLGEGWGVCVWGRPCFVAVVDADGFAIFDKAAR